MNEKRKNKRTELVSRIIIKELSDNSKKEVAVEVTDISKTGVGFACSEPLTIGAVYEGFLTIWTKETLHCFMEIIRIAKDVDNYSYGAIFVGMPELVSQRIEIYQRFDEEGI